MRILLVLLMVLLTAITLGLFSSSSSCRVSFGTYHGHQYRTAETQHSTCLVESKWMKVQQHAVQFVGSSNTITDWLWIDYHDRINVLVQDTAGQFLVFRQTKYALESRQSKAVVGGIVEPHEEPAVAARREVNEEMGGIECQEYIPLGRFRTDVNRGMGWVHPFLARECERPKRQEKDGGRMTVREGTTNNNNNNNNNSDNANDGAEVGAADTERQDLEKLSTEGLLAATKKGEFLEVQWSNTVALALLYLQAL